MFYQKVNTFTFFCRDDLEFGMYSLGKSYTGLYNRFIRIKLALSGYHTFMIIEI